MTRLESPSSRFALLTFFPERILSPSLLPLVSLMYYFMFLLFTKIVPNCLRTLSCILIGSGFPETFKSKQVVLSLLYRHAPYSLNHKNSGLALKKSDFAKHERARIFINKI